ncbi:MAG TPA: exodeoxyribonuclease III [Coxiellaceae bacterium]|nr:exodeoxyribonuclease III [Coxiellaceae bacterium]
MRIITANLNGIRSAAKKGFFKWVIDQNADIICVQEVRGHLGDLHEDVYKIAGYYDYFCEAEKKGYSGVAIYCKIEPDRILRELGWDHADKEGRYIQVDFGCLSVGSLYMPSGTSGEHRQIIKFDFMARFEKWLKKMQKGGRDFILCGDWNIVHTAQDIKNFKSNQKNSGCLPEERAWLDKLFGKEFNCVDAFRVVNQGADQYTWWSHYGQARAKNVGWRIDYQVISPSLKHKVKAAQIYKAENFSDHAPVIIDYDIKLQKLV